MEEFSVIYFEMEELWKSKMECGRERRSLEIEQRK
ncbi:hypothetical protein KSS87_012231 [Heliosperma pusillum]|nr:hypothetical protein KSS87_012231 [Heliosperma pusillum]